MKKSKFDKEAQQTMKSDVIVADPLGSYTGRPADRSEPPVQDADDL